MGDDLWMARSVLIFSLSMKSCYHHKEIIIAKILFLQFTIIVLLAKIAIITLLPDICFTESLRTLVCWSQWTQSQCR